MGETTKMDRAGRLVIPRRVRERYGLVDGSFRLEVVEAPDGILLRPSGNEVPAERHASGWVVFRSGESESTDPVETVEEERRRRHEDIIDEE
jgi:AbrB family looped-hinge helix DNA binding protein